MSNDRMDGLQRVNMPMHTHALLLLRRVCPPSTLEPSGAAAPSKALLETLEWKRRQQVENKVVEAHKLGGCYWGGRT